MLVSINQPAYLPWLGYFHRIAVSDLHVVLDHVQYEKNSFTNRNKIRTANGWTWLTVPVRTGGQFGNLSIASLGVAEDAWRRKHWDTLRQNYAKAPFFQEHKAFLEELFRQEWTQLALLLRSSTDYLLAALGINTPFLYSSDIGVEGAKDLLVLDICRKTKASIYISGALGRDYLREPLFAAEGLKIYYQDYVHPRYRQAFPGFEPHMAVLDLLLNHGPASLQILLEGNETKEDVRRRARLAAD